MADVELLPPPEGGAIGWPQAWSHDQMRAYARANVSRATARLQAEIERLRAEVERLRADRDSWEQQASDRVADWHAEHLRAERLRAEVERLQEVVRPKREDECLTLDHWRMRAYYLEENWSRCSRACAGEQDKREKAEARAERLAEALREWWSAHRPVGWTEDQHRACPYVNLATATDKALAEALLRYQEEGK